MISAKRNKEGEITISGLEVTKYYYFDFAQNGNALIVSRAENRFTIPIEDEKESTSRVFIPNVSGFKITYVPSEKTLIELGFKKWQEDIPHQFVRSFGKFVFQKAIYYNSSTKQFHYFFNDTSQKIYIHSDSELKTLVDILSRES